MTGFSNIEFPYKMACNLHSHQMPGSQRSMALPSILSTLLVRFQIYATHCNTSIFKNS